MRFSYYKIANCNSPCDAVWCNYAILWVILVWFGKYPYMVVLAFH